MLGYEVASKLLAKAGIAYEFAEARGKSALAQVMSLVLLGDYASFYLSILNEVDPTSTDAINFVEQYLAQSPISSDQGRAKRHGRSGRGKAQSIKTVISLLKREPPGCLSGGFSDYTPLRLNFGRLWTRITRYRMGENVYSASTAGAGDVGSYPVSLGYIAQTAVRFAPTRHRVTVTTSVADGGPESGQATSSL
jgi:hypothetical protein